MQKRRLVIGGSSLLIGLTLALLAVILFATQDDGPQFSQWEQAVPVIRPIGDGFDWNYAGCPFISKSGLDLYFRTWWSDSSDVWSWNIYVSHRDTVDDPWETPINLGTNINTSKNELCSFVTIDGHWLYFVSNRTGTTGGADIWVSHRKDKRDDTGWETPKNLGSYVNTSTAQTGPCIFEDEATGEVVLYFTSGVSGKSKILSCPMLDPETPAMPATEVNGLNLPSANDSHAFVRRKDGLEVILISDRDTPGFGDLFVSTRPTTSDAWSTPVNLGSAVNSARGEGRPSISWDGTTLYFWTDREPDPDYPGYYKLKLYQATRTKITGPKK